MSQSSTPEPSQKLSIGVGHFVAGFVGKKRPFRRFPVDMSGFAFSVGMLHLKKPEMPFKATFEEEGFLRSMKLR